MKNIVRTSDIVKRVLEQVPDTRNSDDLLYWIVCERINPIIKGLTFGRVLVLRKELGLPPFESVRRARQKIQQHFPELAGNAEVETQRNLNEEAVRDYARKVNI